MNDRTVILKKRITIKDQGQIFSVPFDVPDQIQTLDIRISVSERGRNCIDFGLDDPQLHRGWSGSARERIKISEEWATPGYLKGVVPSGTWHLLIGAPVVHQTCMIKLKITMQKMDYKWFKGDLHVHTEHSDGDFSLNELVQHIQSARLDYVALTDHNTFTQNKQKPDVEELVLIPATELTTYKGHANVWGCEQPFDKSVCLDKDEVQQCFIDARNQKGVISLNHPFCKDAWQWGFESFEFQFVEVWNGPWHIGNQQALDWWQSKLVEGKRITAVGGSDTHRQTPFRWYGSPTTWIESDRKTRAGLLEGLERGRVCVARDPSAPYMDLRIGGYRMGEIYHGSGDEKLVCTLSEGCQGELRLYSKTGLTEKRELKQEKLEYTFSVEAEAGFYRTEIWAHDATFDKVIPLCISNPIYIRAI